MFLCKYKIDLRLIYGPNNSATPPPSFEIPSYGPEWEEKDIKHHKKATIQICTGLPTKDKAYRVDYEINLFLECLLYCNFKNYKEIKFSPQTLIFKINNDKILNFEILNVYIIGCKDIGIRKLEFVAIV